MIIEFIGLPGSGKSYLSEKIIFSVKNKVYNRKKLENEKINCFEYIKFYANNFMFINILILGLLLNISLDIKKTYTLFIGIKDILKIYTVINIKYKEELIILDEGILQKIIFLFYYRYSKINDILFNIILNKLNKNFIPQILIVVDRDIKSSIKNAKERRSGLPFRFKFFSEKELFDTYKTLVRGIKKTIFLLNNQFNIKIIKTSEFQHDDVKLKKELF